MMKLNLIYEGLSAETKAFVDSFARPSHSDFKSLLLSTLQSLPNSNDNTSPKVPSGLNNAWLGTRLEVEFPVTSSATVKKSLVPELLN